MFVVLLVCGDHLDLRGVAMIFGRIIREGSEDVSFS